jgi:hypothetical protein
MHTTTGPFGATFIHNADMSGGVDIVTLNGRVTVQFGDLLHLITEHVRRERIAQMENADAVTLLGLTRREWDYTHQK